MKPADNNKFVTFCLDPYFAIILGLSFSEDMESQYSLLKKKKSQKFADGKAKESMEGHILYDFKI